MTSQASEILIYNGEQLLMASLPLERYFAKVNAKPKFVSPITANWRGYIGTWEIKEDKLYIIDFKGWLEGNNVVSIEYIFPGQKEVFANWFTGEVRIQKGQLLEYVHFYFESVYEEDLFLKFRRGRLVGSRIEDNVKLIEERRNKVRVYKKTKNKYMASLKKP